MVVRYCKPQEHLLASNTSKIIPASNLPNSSILMFDCISHNLRADIATVSSRRVWADQRGLGSKMFKSPSKDFNKPTTCPMWSLSFIPFYPEMAEMAPTAPKNCRLMYPAIMCQQKSRLPSAIYPRRLPTQSVTAPLGSETV